MEKLNKKMKSSKKSSSKKVDDSKKSKSKNKTKKDLISNEDTWSIINNYFSLGEVQLVKHQISSYNDFIDNHISKIIKSPQYNHDNRYRNSFRR